MNSLRNLLGLRTKRPPKKMLATSDPPIMMLPHVEGVRGLIGYAKGGKGKAKAVCIHGCPGSVRDFRYVAPHLEAQGMEVLRLDLPGHGASLDAGSVRDPDAKEMARISVAVCTDIWGSLPDNKPLIVCHSLGSHIALEMVQMHPDSFSGILLMSPAGCQPHRALQPWWLIRPIAMHVHQHPTSYFTSFVAMLLPTVYQWIGFPILPREEYLYAQKRIAIIDFPEFTESIKKHPTHVPVMVAYSTDDPVCNNAVTMELVQNLDARFGGEGKRENLHILKFSTGGHAVQKAHADAIVAGMEGVGMLPNI